MGFVGSLGDLSVDNILQVVSMSSQTGLLSLQDGDSRAEIAFCQGKVVGAGSELHGKNNFDWLVRRGVVDQERLDQASALLGKDKSLEAVAGILLETCGIPGTAIALASRKEIEKVLTELLRWDQGTFNFETCQLEELGRHLRSSGSIFLHDGIFPRFSLDTDSQPAPAVFPEEIPAAQPMAGTKQDVSILPPRPETEAAQHPWSLSEPACEGTGEVFLVDDDPAVREKLTSDLHGEGRVVSAFANGSELLLELDRVVDQGKRPTLLIDLIMPRFNGEGILGGLELLEVIRSRYPKLPVRMFSDYFCTETEKRIQALGVDQLVVKPHRRTLASKGGAAMEAFVKRVAKVLPTTAEVLKTESQPKEEKGGMLPAPGISPNEGEEPIRRQLALLKTLSNELCVHDLEQQARLLILRFAAELFDRAVIFSVQGDKMNGSGQFGFEKFSGVQGNRLGELVISLKEPSIFTSVLEKREPIKRTLGSGDWERCFAGYLGEPPAVEIFLGPVICQAKVVALLYGDMLAGSQSYGDTDGLEVFLTQVGLLKERALLKAVLFSKGL
ncbi:MAG: response regulator [Syntrophotaleaceae bacterium]